MGITPDLEFMIMPIIIRIYIKPASTEKVDTDSRLFFGTPTTKDARGSEHPAYWTAGEINANAGMIEYDDGEWIDSHHALSWAESFMLVHAEHVSGFDLVVIPAKQER